MLKNRRTKLDPKISKFWTIYTGHLVFLFSIYLIQCWIHLSRGRAGETTTMRENRFI